MTNFHPETITVQTTTLYCDGDANGESGHPRVFLTMNSHGNVDCPYCGRHYILAPTAKVAGGH